VTGEALRVAFFPDAYLEIDGVANTSRCFAAFAKQRGLPFFVVHAGPHYEIETSGSVTRVQLPRGPVGFALDQAHDYDLLFLRHYQKVLSLLRDFRPDLVQITGPSDVGILGALLADKLRVPLAASWQTNLHEYARRRAAAALPFLPEAWSAKLLPAVERWSLSALIRFYKIPRLLFAPNQEIIHRLQEATGKPCFLMSHAVDTTVFSPQFRDRPPGPLRIGYVGRFTTEKNVRLLARLERVLLAKGHEDFEIVLVGQGAEEKWLRKNMSKAQFTGVLTGRDLSRAFANMDIFVFPSETDTFGLVILEALASGVPVVVTARGGPRFSVRHGQTGYVAGDFDELVACTVNLLTQPGLLAEMRGAARQYALSSSWDQIFDGMYTIYERFFPSAASPGALGMSRNQGEDRSAKSLIL